MIKQASSCLKEAVESIRFEVDGVGDGKAWSEQIPQDKTGHEHRPEDPPHISVTSSSS